MSKPYCPSVYQTQRWKTREIRVGNVGVGGNNPVRIQSMTTSSTRDVEATVEQTIRLADAGCEIVRFTVQGKKEAAACEQIKNTLIQRGYGHIPLVADIHFYPPAAMQVVEFVDKVRVNPGNFADQRASFRTIEYTDETYSQELERIEQKFSPLVVRCKELGRAMRIGTNHGSLSDRIMNRYGDTPQGMVESAIEYARVCRQHDFHNFLFSMKASNPKVMIQAYRLLVAEMMALGWDYPLHLGVTEAGEGEDGRVKSAMGIGALLLDGIGDTIRVSLTEDPWYEIDPCQRLVRLAKDAIGQGVDPFEETGRNIETMERRTVVVPENLPLHRDGSVYLWLTEEQLSSEGILEELGAKERGIDTIDGVFLEKPPVGAKAKEVIGALETLEVGVFYASELPSLGQAEKQARFGTVVSRAVVVSEEDSWETLRSLHPQIIFWKPKEHYLHNTRRFFEWVHQNKLKASVILVFDYTNSKQDFIMQSAAEAGSLLCDGLGEGVLLRADHAPAFLKRIGFQILQAARMRMFKTEFISCPSCGRTLFNLQEVSQRIREQTEHLPGVKIAIMGCIVNGPGEMADADFGYVGSKAGMVDLYVGKECVEKNIPFDEADGRLIELIKSHGRWVEPELVGV